MSNIFNFSNPLIQTAGTHYQKFSKYILLEYPKKSVLLRYLGFLKKWDTSFIYFHTDRFFQEDLEKIQEYTKIILDNSSLFIRFVSSSILLFDLAVYLKKYKNRIFYSIPIEDSETEQLVAFKALQNHGFNTFATIKASTINCEQIANSVSPSLCESIWIEPQDSSIEVIKKISNLLKQFQQKTFYLLKKEVLDKKEDQYLKTVSNIEYITDI